MTSILGGCRGELLAEVVGLTIRPINRAIRIDEVILILIVVVVLVVVLSGKVSGQMVLPTELEHSGKMVCLLIRFHFGYSFWLDAAVGPENVKVFMRGFFRTLDHQFEVVSGIQMFFYGLE